MYDIATKSRSQTTQQSVHPVNQLERSKSMCKSKSTRITKKALQTEYKAAVYDYKVNLSNFEASKARMRQAHEDLISWRRERE